MRTSKPFATGRLEIPYPPCSRVSRQLVNARPHRRPARQRRSDMMRVATQTQMMLCGRPRAGSPRVRQPPCLRTVVRMRSPFFHRARLKQDPLRTRWSCELFFPEPAVPFVFFPGSTDIVLLKPLLSALHPLPESRTPSRTSQFFTILRVKIDVWAYTP